MRWEECVEKKVYKKKKDKERAKSLFKIVKVREEDNRRRKRKNENVPLIVESYWEIIKQLITALLNLNGFKSYSQECLISYVDKFYNFNKNEIELMDELRKIRNDIDYRGKFLDLDYLERKESKIKNIVSKLEENFKEKLNH